jgi:hypothetical protein
MSKTATDIPTEEIARRAYEIWEARGRPAGDGSEDWDAAVAELGSRSNGHGVLGWWQRLRQKISGGDS